MIGFVVVVALFWVAMHAYIAWRVTAAFAAPLWVVQSALGVAAFVALSWVAGMIAVRGAGGDSPVVSVRSFVWGYFGFFSILMVALLTRDAGLFLVHAIRRIVGDNTHLDSGRRDLLQMGSALLAVGGSLGLSAAAVRGGTRLAPVVRVEVPVAGLHPDLDGYRICQISDIHVGQPLRKRDLEAIVARVNELGADLIAVTGDLVDARVRLLATEVEPVFDLRARDGVFFVTGNHEYYSGAKQWEEWLRDGGIDVLTNEHRLLPVGNARLLLGGVTDYTAGQFFPEDASDPARAMAGAPECDYRLLLAHQPKSVPAARLAGWQLQLSGHTHGGQYVPFTWVVDRFHPVGAGLTKLEDFHVYVSRGTGVWGPPMRLGAPNEITEIVLRRA